MKPVLYYDERSPPVRSVLILIKLLDIDVDLKFVDLFKGDQLKSYFRELNPAHTVPVLVDDDLVLTDSHTILIHLCEKYQADTQELWPKEYKERMGVLNLLMFECSLIFRRDSDMMSEVIRKTFANTDLDYHQRKIHEVYDMAEKYLNNHTYIASEKLTIADVSAITTLSTVDLMFPIEATAKWPSLAVWFQKMKHMPEYHINQRGLDMFRVDCEKYGKFKFSECNEINNAK